MKKITYLFTATLILTFVIAGVALASSSNNDASALIPEEEPEGCLTCNESIENIVEPQSDMYKQLLNHGGCTSHHGDNADETEAADVTHERDLSAGSGSSPQVEIAMKIVPTHQEKLACYACQADWAPQCYGCRVTADYIESNTGKDWVNDRAALEP